MAFSTVSKTLYSYTVHHCLGNLIYPSFAQMTNSVNCTNCNSNSATQFICIAGNWRSIWIPACCVLQLKFDEQNEQHKILQSGGKVAL